METKLKLGNGWEGHAKIITQPNLYKKVEKSEIFETTHYEQFSYDNRNRPLVEDKVSYFIKQFTKGNFFMKEFPVIIDNKFVILDGQHRYEAVKRMELLLYFKFAHTLSIENIVDVQINAGWSTKDYIHTFIKQKKQDYVVLHRFIQRYKISVSVAVMLLTAIEDKSSLRKSGFYEGNFKIKDEAVAHENAKAINEIGTLALGLHRDRTFCIGVVKIMSHPDYEHKRMIEQMTKYSSLMRRQMTVDNYIRNLEDVYNYKLYTKNKVRFV